MPISTIMLVYSLDAWNVTCLLHGSVYRNARSLTVELVPCTLQSNEQQRSWVSLPKHSITCVYRVAKKVDPNPIIGVGFFYLNSVQLSIRLHASKMSFLTSAQVAWNHVLHTSHCKKTFSFLHNAHTSASLALFYLCFPGQPTISMS